MNDQTPRRYKGTLLERAAEQFHYAQPPVVESRPAPQQMPAYEAPEPIYELEEPAIRRGFAAEEPVRKIESGRRTATIDREALRRGGMIVPGGSITPLAEEIRRVKRQRLLTARTVSGMDGQRARMILVC